MNSILVTGARGFLGRYVTTRLIELGMSPVVFDTDLDSSLDVTKPDRVATYVEHADGVIHLAGILGTHELFDDVQRTVDVNIGGTINVLEAIRNLNHPIPFVGIEQPHIWYNPYEASKLAARRYTLSYAKAFDIPVSYVRAFNAFGPGQAPPGPGHPQKIIPAFSLAAWKDEPIQIWGDGTAIVDLVWAGDVADILIETLLTTTSTTRPDRVIEAGSGVPWPVKSVEKFVVDHVENVLRKESGEWKYRPAPEHNSMRRGEQDSSVESNVATNKKSSFRTTLLRQTIDWYRRFV